MQPWWHTVVELLEAGREAEAVTLTRKAAERGSLAARVRLARFLDLAGISQDEADEIVDKASDGVREDDQTGNWVLSGAYELLFGRVDYAEKSRRMLHHLEAYARSSADPQACLAVAINWSLGRPGVAANPAVAVDWFCIAEALGHAEAAIHLRRYERWLTRNDNATLKGAA